MALGAFLAAYLKRAGVEHIFGLPGDLVLGLFHRFGSDRGLEIVTLSHEPSVGFAADGYARASRRLGVVCVTYGAGGHNVVNAVAGAYAESVPLLVVSGGPGEAEQKVALVHHQVKGRRRPVAHLRRGVLPRDARRSARAGCRADPPDRRRHPRRAPPGLPRDPPRHGRRRDPRAALAARLGRQVCAAAFQQEEARRGRDRNRRAPARRAPAAAAGRRRALPRARRMPPSAGWPSTAAPRC